MIDKTISTSNPNTNPETTLDTILFNATTIAREHIEYNKREKMEEENYLITEIKTTTAQLEHKDNYGPLNQKELKHTNSLENKLRKLQIEYQTNQKQKFQDNYLENLRNEVLNPQKPSRDYKKTPNSSKSTLSEIYVENPNLPPVLSKDQNTVHKEIYSFYSKLFAYNPCNSNLVDLKQFMGDIPLKQTSSNENEMLQTPITKLKIEQILKTMSNHNAPGFTGTIPAFYKVFWSKLANLVTLSVQNCLQKKNCPLDKK